MPRKYKRSKKKISRKIRGGGRTTKRTKASTTKAPTTKAPTTKLLTKRIHKTPASTTKGTHPSKMSWMTKVNKFFRRTPMTPPSFSLEVPENTQVKLNAAYITVYEDMEPFDRGFTMAFNSSNYDLYDVSLVQEEINGMWNRKTVGWKTVNGEVGMVGYM